MRPGFQNPFDVSLEVRVEGLNLSAEQEFDPFLLWHGTWTGARFSRRTGTLEMTKSSPWVGLCELQLPDLRRYPHDDQMLHLDLKMHSRRSGLDEIDATESGYVKRQLTGGTASVALDVLLRAGAEGTALDFVQWMVESDVRTHAFMSLAPQGKEAEVLSDPIKVLGEARAREVAVDAINIAYKGRMRVRARILDGMRTDTTPTHGEKNT